MNRQLLLYGGMLILLLSLLLGMLALKQLKVDKQRKFQRSKVNTRPVNGGYLLIYRLISKNFLTKHSVHNIRSRLEIVGNSNERTIRKKVVQITMAIAVTMLLLFSAIILVTKQLLMILLFMAVLCFLSETLVDFFIIRLKNRLLKQQIKFNDLIRHKYYETGMVDEAIYLSCQSLDRHHYEIALQGQRMHDVLMAKNVEKEMVIYNDTAPNKYLKMLLGLAYMTMEYGDSDLDGSSVFMRNMGDLTGEIRVELSKRERLNYALKSLNVIVLMPLFCITPIRQWASNYFMPLKVFYESQTGFFLEVVTMVMIFVCYMLLRRIQQFDDQRHIYKKRTFEQRIYDLWLYPLIDFIKPGRKRYYHMKRRLKAAASHLSVEAFTTRKLLSFTLGLLFAFGFVLALQYNQRHQILRSPTLPEQFLGGQLSDAERAKADAITSKDTAYLSQMTSATTAEDLAVMLEDEGLPIEETMIIAERLMTKQAILFNQYVKWWEVGLMLSVALFSYQLPMIYLYFQQRVMKIELEDEVAGFSTIILMLMHHERMSVEDVLEWMGMYASAFREPIGDCLNSVAAGLTEALESLKEVSDNERFINIVESLMLASEDITIRQAFDELASDKEYYMEARKESNQRIVERKINMGRMIGFTPVYGLIILYMVIPMISTSMTDMQQYFNQLR